MPNTSYETQFDSVNPSDIPRDVADTLMSQGSLYIDSRTSPQSIADFDDIRTVIHGNDDVSYLANQNKTYINGDKEKIIHLVDTSPRGQVTGVGEVRFNPTSEKDYFKEKPFVGWTSTEVEFQHQGLGRRRLIVMKLATAAEFGLSLHSGTVFSDPNVTKIWERIVDSDEAERYDQLIKEGKTLRYKFKDENANGD